MDMTMSPVSITLALVGQSGSLRNRSVTVSDQNCINGNICIIPNLYLMAVRQHFYW